jgi:PAS domain S-box-containing protein/putative nucleotidyltransferase with HDIG domain
MNKKSLNILILEDNPDDAEFMVAELKKNGYTITWNRVETKESFEKSLKDPPDLILADYKLPSINALDALKIKQEIASTIPFIIVSGTIGEEFAVECIKAGATDYVLKDRLFRLTPVVERALKEAKEYEKHKQAEDLFKQLFLSSPNAIFIIQDGKFKLVNPQFVKESGFSEEELLDEDSYKLVYSKDRKMLRENIIKNLKNGLSSPFEYRAINKNGQLRWALQVITSITYQGERAVLGNIKDISEIKQAQIRLKKSYQRLQKTMQDTIRVIAKVVEVKDPYTSGHQHRVSQLATSIAQELKLPPDKLEGIRISALVHDIGKISVPAEILSKPTRLNEIEYGLIKDHSQIGYDILKTIDFPWPVAQIILQHHERIDGSGYPQGLKGNKILLEARIMGVADVVEAISSHRPYRPALGIDKALEEISQNKGILYDPEVVDICIKLFKEKGFKFEL